MVSKFQKLDPARAELMTQDVLHDPVANLSRLDLLTIQFSKCINYFRFNTSPEWGGKSNESHQNSITAGLSRFFEDVDAHGPESHPKWLRKKLAGLPWGPDNFRLCAEPAIELGYPFEPYLTVNGAILTINQASRILSVRQMDLVKLKCALIEDQLVIDYALREMLKPRPTWPRIQLKPGGKGRSYRFGDEDA